MSEPLIVFEHPLSPYVQKVKIALREKGLAFSVQMPGFGSDAAVAEFASLSPRREVPLLLHGNYPIVESSIMLAYIEETWPSPPLLPTNLADRARVRMVEHAMDTQFEANTWGLGEVHIFGRAEGQLAAQLTAFAEQQIQLWYQWLETQLNGQPWFNGSAFGYGDLCVVPYVNGAARFDIRPHADSQLAAWLAQVNQRESIAQTQAEASAAELDPATMQAAVTAGFQREYRDYRLEWMVQAGGIDVVADGITKNNIRFNSAFQ